MNRAWIFESLNQSWGLLFLTLRQDTWLVRISITTESILFVPISTVLYLFRRMGKMCFQRLNNFIGLSEAMCTGHDVM